jgi:xylan 1,4-beta-xylosidase
MFANPVLAGCYPDASVCRIGDDFYLVTSTFEYFPGLPVFRSSDLVNWTQVGHAIDRPNQLDLSGVPSSGGLFAPTIRFHEGLFYLVCTLVHGTGAQGNFLVTAADAAGPWSDPTWLDVDGIDPSLLFDDDGRAWLCGTRLAEPGLWEGQTDVWLRELSLPGGTLVGPEHVIWRGALQGAVWAEGPHIYRTADGYLLLAAEGGTERNHAVSVARSDAVTGPYVGNPANPVLTHRNLGLGASIVGVGHAELIEGVDGRWWATVLGTRTIDGLDGILGRETNLVPVEWQSGWPVFAPGVARVEAVVEGPDAAPAVFLRETFDASDPFELGPGWNLVRTSPLERYSLRARPGWLRLPALPVRLSDVGAPAFVGRRLQHPTCTVRTLLEFEPEPGDEAGIALRQSEDDQIRLAIVLAGDERHVVAVRRIAGVEVELASAALDLGSVELGIAIDGGACVLHYRCGGERRALATTSCVELSSAVAGGFLGVWAGMYAIAGSAETASVADFDWFDYLV